MSHIAVQIENLGKRYRIGQRASYKALRDTLTAMIFAPVRHARARLSPHRVDAEVSEYIWALRDVSFEVREGEVLGIIGRNGAGKSTLLKILSRITEPTTGRARVAGRIGSLLEVGTGFHPELTGRENIQLNAAILGMKRGELAHRFDPIVEFAGVEKFLDTPVKRYSSGMYLRLAFAVAAHLDPEILVVDEVLAVGDAEFQRKCLGKMGEVASEKGRTVLFVSHNMVAIEHLCSRVIYLCDGRVEYDGPTSAGIGRYLSSTTGAANSRAGVWDLRQGNGSASPDTPILRTVTLLDGSGQACDSIKMGGALSVVIDVDGLSEVPDHLIGIRIKSEWGQLLINTNTRKRPFASAGRRTKHERVVLEIESIPLTPARYWLDIGVKDGVDNKFVELAERAASFNVVAADVYGTGQELSSKDGIVFVHSRWEVGARDAASP